MKVKYFLIFLLTTGIVKQAISQGVWVQKADFGGTARVEAVGFSIGSKGYLGTGSDSTGWKKDFWEWDQATDTWVQKSDTLPQQQMDTVGTYGSGKIGFSIGVKGYIGTGMFFINQGYSKDFWEWDQATDTWTQKTSFGGTERENSIGFSIGTKGYIGTGSDWAYPYGRYDFWEWDQSTNTWTQKSNVGGAKRTRAVGFSIGTKGYIGTGMTSNGLTSDFWEWDQTTDIWTQKADFGGGKRMYAVGFSIGNKGYIGIGTDSSNINHDDFWEWNQNNNTWTQVANFGGGKRTMATGFSLGMKGYVGTGYDSTIGYKDFWEFSPSTNIINENESENILSIYPNPFYSQLILKTNRILQNATLMVYNANGEIVGQIKNIYGQKIIFNRNNLKSGLYFFQLTENNNAIAKNKFLMID